MLGDVADYSAWKFKRRSTGVVFAGVSFALKMGLGVGLATAAWIKEIYRIDANTFDTEGFRLGASIYPGILFAVGVVFLLFYSISPKLEQQIQDELAERRK